MHEFDGMQRGSDPDVFVSEYAVTADGGWGNLKVRHTLPNILRTCHVGMSSLGSEGRSHVLRLLFALYEMWCTMPSRKVNYVKNMQSSQKMGIPRSVMPLRRFEPMAYNGHHTCQSGLS